MKLEEAILKRRAHYSNQFSGEPIEEAHIERMLELANWAPTHLHTEPWRFQVYEGEAMRRLIDRWTDLYVRTTPAAEFNPNFVEKMAKRKEQISHLLVIAMTRDERLPEFEELSSVAMAVQNMWLYLAQFPDMGGYWSTPKLSLTTDFAEVLELGPTERCLGLFYLGKLKEDRAVETAHRGPWKEKVKWFKN